MFVAAGNGGDSPGITLCGCCLTEGTFATRDLEVTANRKRRQAPAFIRPSFSSAICSRDPSISLRASDALAVAGLVATVSDVVAGNSSSHPMSKRPSRLHVSIHFGSMLAYSGGVHCQ